MKPGLFGSQSGKERTGTVFGRNAPYVIPGATQFNTALTPTDEASFRSWLTEKNVPFDPTKEVSDYDMRGFWRALQAGDPIAKGAIDPNDGQMHYPDFWKTPYHATFSNESQWALPTAPHWTPDDRLVTPSGAVVFDDRAKQRLGKIGLFGNGN